MTQRFFDRCLIVFAFWILILAILTGCTPGTEATPNEQFAEPLVGELNFEERPSPTNPDVQTINLILINATLAADDDDVAIDGRGLETPLRHLAHCGSFFFDGEQLSIAGNRLSSRAAYAVLMDYSGISLSTGGANTREDILNNDVTAYPVPLALDTDVTFYTIDLGETYLINLWQGEQNGNQISTDYKRPFANKLGRVTISESHEITILHNVPVTYRAPGICE